jgi:hypothetical protein
MDAYLGLNAFATEEDLTGKSKPTGREALSSLTNESALGDRLKSMVSSTVKDTVDRVRAARAGDAKLSTEELDFILADMFVNVEDDARDQSGVGASAGTAHEMQGCKAAPHGSLLSLLSLYMALVHDRDGMRGYAEVWKEFVLELRWHWTNLRPIPRISVTGGPDMRYSLLHQKIQMIQCCIEHELALKRLKEHPSHPLPLNPQHTGRPCIHACILIWIASMALLTHT